MQLPNDWHDYAQLADVLIDFAMTIAKFAFFVGGALWFFGDTCVTL